MMNRFNISLVVLVMLTFVSCGKRYHLDREDINQESSWPYFRGDISSTGVASNSGFSGKLEILWKRSQNSKPVGPLTLYQRARGIDTSLRKRVKTEGVV